MKNGDYIVVKAPENYPGRTYKGKLRLVLEHHLVWWQNSGQVVPPGMVVHHKNEDKFDNKFSNLELLTKAEHASHHHIIKPWVWIFCVICKSGFLQKPNTHRAKLRQNKTEFCCSRKCQVTKQQAERRIQISNRIVP